MDTGGCTTPGFRRIFALHIAFLPRLQGRLHTVERMNLLLQIPLEYLRRAEPFNPFDPPGSARKAGFRLFLCIFHDLSLQKGATSVQ